MPQVTRESKIEAKVVRFCHEQGLYCRKFSSPSNAGVPDRVIVGPAGVLFLELKRPGNKPTALQERELRLIQKQGARAGWSDDAETAIRAIARYCLGQTSLGGVVQLLEDAKFIIPERDDRLSWFKSTAVRKHPQDLI